MVRAMTRPCKYFAIIGAMRTGSNLLEKTIAALGDTVCYGEAFNPAFVGGPRKAALMGWTRAERDTAPFEFFETLLATEPDLIPGFRIFNGHDEAILRHVLTDPQCARVVLTRNPIESFISLRIAQLTGRWLQRKPGPQIEVRARFDGPAFEDYRAQLNAYYSWVSETMAAAGQSALRIDYSELSEPIALQRVADHIGSAGRLPSGPPIQRQNPVEFSRKVENYYEMCAWLGLSATAGEELPVAEIGDVLLPPSAKLAFMPIEGVALLPALALLQRVESTYYAAPALSHGELTERAAAARLFPLATHVDDLAGRRAFVLVAHPLRRLHGAFVDDVFGTGWQHSPVRRALSAAHAPIPSLRAIVNGQRSLSTERHRAIFRDYLEIVARTLRGEGMFGARAIWRPQSEFVSACESFAKIDGVARLEEFPQLGHWICDELGLDRLPPGQLNGLAKTGEVSQIPIEQVNVPEIRELAAQIHSADFDAFGYSDNPLAEG